MSRPASSVEELESLLLLAHDGDTIVVGSEWEKEIGEEILRRKRPGLKITFTVESGVARLSQSD